MLRDRSKAAPFLLEMKRPLKSLRPGKCSMKLDVARIGPRQGNRHFPKVRRRSSLLRGEGQPHLLFCAKKVCRAARLVRWSSSLSRKAHYRAPWRPIIIGSAASHQQSSRMGLAAHSESRFHPSLATACAFQVLNSGLCRFTL